MPSLLDAIEAKYGQDGRDSEAPIGIRVPRIGPRKSIPRLLILNDCNVDSAGDENQLEKTCSGVLEIDLAHNRLTEWNEISKILQYSPAATFLNLSFNSLSTPVTLACHENKFEFPFLPRLNTLILIGTSITWDTVWFLLKRATSLQELHLSMNDFKTVDLTSSRRTCCNGNGHHENDADAEKENVEQMSMSTSPSRIDEDSGNYSDSGIGSSSDDDDGICFPHLKRLMFDGNPINSWDEVAKLGMCFQSLRHLGLSDCPIEEITEDACQYFENLQSLSLSNTLIHDLEHVSRLNLLSSLTEVRIQGIPLLNDMTAHERRQLLVALLKNVKKLNGGAPISTTERESAERAFIRHFAQSQDNKPQRYFELLAIHGELAPLIDVQFKPNAKIKVRVCYERFMEERQVCIYQTTHELKTTLEPILGITSSKMRLFYVDPALQGIFGREELRLPQKQLYSYNMQDGDEIHVEQKVASLVSPAIPSTSGATRDGPPSPSRNRPL